MRSRSPTIEEKALTIVGRFISPILARSIVTRALVKAGVQGHARAEGDLSRLAAVLEDAARLFIEPSKADELRRALQELGERVPTNGRPEVEERTFPIRVESDISLARTSARELAEQLGAPRYVSQRIATVVSELARNIVNYTPGGVIEISSNNPSGSRSITIKASDEGKGIRNLGDILSGKYVSSTGLGAGIRGAKRLADDFEIQTGEKGTRITAMFRI
jgi:serine/threonine-protein kinase RsbT